MGFIEDQRRQRQREIYARQQQAELQAKSREEDQKNRESAIKESARRRALYEESVRRYRQSGLPLLISELGKLGRYKGFFEVEYDPQDYHRTEHNRESHRCYMTISEHTVNGVIVEVKSIYIETNPEGNIKFNAGFLGSSTIRQSSWQRNRDSVEKALGRAYNHPTIYRYTSTPSPRSEEGSGPSL